MNESAGTEVGPMEALQSAVLDLVDNDGEIRERLWDAYYAALREVDAEIRALTASRDRLADALREAREYLRKQDGPFCSDGCRHPSCLVVATVDAALTDIPDCPHAQRVEALEKAIRTTLIVGCVLQEQEPCAIRSGMHSLRAALTASTGEANHAE